MKRVFSCYSGGRPRAFTLIELLTVIAIIGILAAIIIPTVGAVRVSAKKAQVRSQFAQWANAYSLFKQEYGYYPRFDADGGYVLKDNDDTEKFLGTFTGKTSSGGAPTSANLNGNKKKMGFHVVTNGELKTEPIPATAAKPILCDAFGNLEIGVIVDWNGDGRITIGASGDAPSLAGVKSIETDQTFTPTNSANDDDIPSTDGVRAEVIFYSAGKDGSRSGAVMSWK